MSDLISSASEELKLILVIPTQFGSKSLLVWMGRWLVDKTKIMQCHLLSEVVADVEDEFGKN